MRWNTKRLLSPRVMGWSSLVLILPFLLLALAGWYRWGWLGDLDTKVGLEVTEERTDLLTAFFKGMTELGGLAVTVGVVIIVCLFLYLRVKRRDLALWYVLTVALGAGVLNPLIKSLFHRPRPLTEHLVVQGGYSFPSGHSMGATILYGALVFLVVRLAASRTIKWLSLLLAAGVILLVGLSRIYLGVHFPSDVIGGFSLGTAWLAGCIGAYGMWEAHTIKEKHPL